jgi:hypothetical protein
MKKLILGLILLTGVLMSCKKPHYKSYKYLEIREEENIFGESEIKEEKAKSVMAENDSIASIMVFKNYCTYVLVYQEMQKSLKMKVSKPVDFKLINDKGEEVLTSIYTHQESEMQKCITILDEIQKWVVKGVTKKISASKVNKMINPLIKQYDGILIKLDKIDSDVVKQYRTQLANKMIDLQMQQ